MTATEPTPHPEVPDPEARERGRSPRRGMCAAVLSLEAIVVGLSTPVLIVIADLSLGVGLTVGLGLALACVLVAGMLRAEWGYALGWAVQAGAVALGLVVPQMFFLGGVFAALWATAYFLGKRIEAERAAAWAAYDAERAAGA
jgi:hypothetical protein